MDLNGQVALVTGGGGEIGGAIAALFAGHGAAVVVCDVHRDKADRVAAAIIEKGGRAPAGAAAVAKAEDCAAAVATAQSQYGRLTCLVNTAATVTPDGTVETLTLDQWNETIAVNLTGVFLMCKYAVPAIRGAGGGTIVTVASQLGQIGVPLRSPYGTTKAALIQFSRCLAIDHAPDNIRVNTVSPGPIDTERTLRRFGGDRAAANVARGPGQLLGRTGRPEEVAEAALYLASHRSSFVTGTDLLVDGGYLAFKGVLRPAVKDT
jgi:NAD(P)-dependent dehydrogenase (short-subunit alcohol dehydrogenase family)